MDFPTQKLIPYTKELPGDRETPITLYEKYVGDDIGFLLESKESGKGRYSFIGKAPCAVLESKNGDTTLTNESGMHKENGRVLDFIKHYMAQVQVEAVSPISFIGGGIGTIAYDVIRQYEQLPDENPDELGLPDVHLMFVKRLIAYDHYHDTIQLIVLEENSTEGKSRAQLQFDSMIAEISAAPALMPEPAMPSAVREPLFTTTKEAFMKNVLKAKQYIFDGDIFQAVLSQRCSVETQESPFTLYRKLRALNPSAYLFYLNFGSYQVVGSSPEMLVALRNNRISTCPIAGTRSRGKNESQDSLLSRELLNDEKEKAEHGMLVDLARNDMGRVAQIGSVTVSEFMKVKYYSHVMHLVSLVNGHKANDQDAFSILSAFLPAGTLSGAPKIRAMEIIDELENTRRGLYGGAVGYFGFDGSMDMCIAIRMMIIKDCRAYMQAGAGIVADSDPEMEYKEVQNKLGAMIKAVGGKKS